MKKVFILLFMFAFVSMLANAQKVNKSDCEIIIDSFPWEESFEAEVFPETCWAIYDDYNVGTTWERRTTADFVRTGTASAVHSYNEQYLEGWLVTPRIVVPETDSYIFSFWSKNFFIDFYGKNSVWISTGSGDPSDGDFVEVWTIGSVVQEWVDTKIALSDYAGETIYVAFKYEGLFAHEWYIDDLSIYKDTSGEVVVIDTFPWEEGFESKVFPDGSWGVYDILGIGATWERKTNAQFVRTGTASAVHSYNEQHLEGWLVTPQIVIPETDSYAFSFWSKNLNAYFYGKNSVWVSTGSADPSDGDFVEVWTTGTVLQEWVETIISLSDYAGETIHLAFKYEGQYAHEWCIDDLSIYQEMPEEEVIIDTFPWEEGFEAEAFPETSWAAFDFDDIDFIAWLRLTNPQLVRSGVASASHSYAPNQEGWLVTPKIVVPNTGHYRFSFWSMLYFYEFYGRSSVWISTGSGDPSDGDFVEVWTPETITGDWTETQLMLSDYAGEIIHIAFKYEGDNNHQWIIDDLSIYMATENDLAVLSIMPNYVMPGASATPVVTVLNLGVNTATNWIVQVTDGNGYVSTKPGTSVAYEETVSITMDEWTSTATSTLTAVILYDVDEDLTNNELSKDIDYGYADAYACNTFSTNTYAKINLATGKATMLAPVDVDAFPIGEDYDGEYIYRMHENRTVARVFPDGTYEELGTLTGLTDSYDQPVGITFDWRTKGNGDRWYLNVVNRAGGETTYPKLYSFDMNSLTASLVGESTDVDFFYGLDMADDGYLYCISITNSALMKIDPTTAGNSVVGYLDFTLSYHQDVAFDAVENKLYTIAFNGNAVLGSYDLETGEFTQIHNYGLDQFSTLTITNVPTLDCGGYIDSFPWEEGFESEVFPEECWGVYDIKNVGHTWERVTNTEYVRTGNASALHSYQLVNQEGWLVIPQIVIPDTDTYIFSFWSMNNFPESYSKNSVWISTGSSDPSDGDFVEVWTPETVVKEWVETKILLSDYASENIHIAFRYDGAFAHQWYIDDLSIYKALEIDIAMVNIAPNYVMPGTAVAPVVMVLNLGINTATNWTIQVSDGNGYVSTRPGTPVAYDETITIVMDEWTPTTASTLTALILCEDDGDLTNNKMTKEVDYGYAEVYAANSYPNYVYSKVDLATGELTELTKIDDVFPVGEDYDGSYIYRIHDDATIARVFPDGSCEMLGTLTGFVHDYYQPVGMAFDWSTKGKGDRWYLNVMITDDGETYYPTLYVIDINTLVVNLVGESTDADFFRGLDMANDGYLYCVSSINSALIKIDPDTGENSIVGSIGFQPLFAQEVSFDEVSKMLYTIAFSGDTFDAALGTYDLGTGSFTEIHNYGLHQFSTFTITNNAEGGVIIPDVTASNESLVYPNPAIGRINIKVTDKSSVRIVDVTGRLIEVLEFGANTVNTIELAAGIYIVRIDSQGKEAVHKVIVK